MLLPVYLLIRVLTISGLNAVCFDPEFSNLNVAYVMKNIFVYDFTFFEATIEQYQVISRYKLCIRTMSVYMDRKHYVRTLLNITNLYCFDTLVFNMVNCQLTLNNINRIRYV